MAMNRTILIYVLRSMGLTVSGALFDHTKPGYRLAAVPGTTTERNMADWIKFTADDQQKTVVYGLTIAVDHPEEEELTEDVQQVYVRLQFQLR